MSRMIPQPTIDVLRNFADISVGLYGIECELRTPINVTQVESLDAYVRPQDMHYESKQTTVFIEWKADEKRLRKMGVFTEGSIPIIAWFAHTDSVVIGSYIKVPIQYVPKQYGDVDEFEIIDVVIRGMHDAIIINAFKIAPRRVKNVLGG